MFKPKRGGHDTSWWPEEVDTIEAYHVPRFTLLISPDAFDLGRPVRVVTNGEVSFEGRVEPSVATLRKWAARDHDRTMLFAAEITVVLESR